MLHGSNRPGVQLGVNSGGVPFFWGTYGSYPSLFGTAFDESSDPAPGVLVLVDYREIHPGSSWRRVGQKLTGEHGGFEMLPDDYAVDYFPHRSGVFRARLSLDNGPIAPAESSLVGFFVVPRIEVDSPALQRGTVCVLAGVVHGPSDIRRIVVRRPGAGTVSQRVHGGRFRFRLTLPRSGTFTFRLEIPSVLDRYEGSQQLVHVTLREPPPPVVPKTPRPAPTRTVVSRVTVEPTRPAPRVHLPDVGF